jgi:hypothetical protein
MVCWSPTREPNQRKDGLLRGQPRSPSRAQTQRLGPSTPGLASAGDRRGDDGDPRDMLAPREEAASPRLEEPPIRRIWPRAGAPRRRTRGVAPRSLRGPRWGEAMGGAGSWSSVAAVEAGALARSGTGFQRASGQGSKSTDPGGPGQAGSVCRARALDFRGVDVTWAAEGGSNEMADPEGQPLPLPLRVVGASAPPLQRGVRLACR